MDPTVTVVAVAVLLGCSAFFSSTETALFSLSPERLAALPDDDARSAGVRDLLADPHRLLVTILVGNNVVNIAVSSLVTALLVDRVQSGSAVLVATLVVSALVLVVGEIVPKSYGLGNAEAHALRIVRPLRYVEVLLYPVVVAFDVLTRQLGRLLGSEPAIERVYDEDPTGPSE